MRWVAVLLCLTALAWLLLDDGDRVQPITPRDDSATDTTRPGLLGTRSADAISREGTIKSGAVSGAAGAAEAGTDDVRASLRIDTVDALTGRAIEAKWNIGYGEVTAGPFPPGVVIDAAALAAQARGVKASIAAWVADFRPSGESRPDVLASADAVDLGFSVLSPRGYVVDDPRPRMRGQLAVGVRRAEYLQPLWREATLDVRVLDPEGLPVRDVGIFRLAAAGRIRDVKPEVRAPGELRIRGLPHFPGEPVRAVLDWGWSDDEKEEIVEEEIDEGPELSDAHLVTKMPADLSRPWQVEVRLKAKRGPRYFDWVETDHDLDFEESFGLSDAVPSKLAPAAVRARVLGWDGKPIQGARVNGIETDAQGVALRTGLRPGEEIIFMTAPGRFGARETVALAPGVTHGVTLREPLGARLEVSVVDGQGHPRPSARLEIRGCKLFDVRADGVQRLDMFTDAHGRRTFARVEPGEAMIVATWGSHTGARSVTLVDGETQRVEITAR